MGPTEATLFRLILKCSFNDFDARNSHNFGFENRETYKRNRMDMQNTGNINRLDYESRRHDSARHSGHDRDERRIGFPSGSSSGYFRDSSRPFIPRDRRMANQREDWRHDSRRERFNDKGYGNEERGWGDRPPGGPNKMYGSGNLSTSQPWKSGDRWNSGPGSSMADSRMRQQNINSPMMSGNAPMGGIFNAGSNVSGLNIGHSNMGGGSMGERPYMRRY